MSKVIAIFGAGTGLGAAVARRFGREGYAVALVARRQDALGRLAARLQERGIVTATFSADLSDSAGVPALVAAIMARFGRIDVIEYAPVSSAPFIAATALTAAALERLVGLYLSTPVELVQAVLPGMLARGDGGILFGHGVSAVQPLPYMSGVGVVMAAARNYIYSLYGELADKGVYAGTLSVAAAITGSEGHAAMTSGALKLTLPPGYVIPTVEADELAELYWRMLCKRDRAEMIFPS